MGARWASLTRHGRKHRTEPSIAELLLSRTQRPPTAGVLLEGTLLACDARSMRTARMLRDG